MENEKNALIEQAKSVLFSPKEEWVKIDSRNNAYKKILMSYLLILAAIPAVFVFIGYGIIGYGAYGIRVSSVEFGIKMAIVQYVSIVIGCFMSAFVINELSEKFGAQKNFDKAFALVAYSYTAICVGGVFYLYYKFTALAILAGIYALYLLYIGIKPMMKAPEDKAAAYFGVSLLVLIVVYATLMAVLVNIFIGRYWSSLYW